MVAGLWMARAFRKDDPDGRTTREPQVDSLCTFTGSHFVPASLYFAAICLRVSSAGPFVSSSDAASELLGLWNHCTRGGDVKLAVSGTTLLQVYSGFCTLRRTPRGSHPLGQLGARLTRRPSRSRDEGRLAAPLVTLARPSRRRESPGVLLRDGQRLGLGSVSSSMYGAAVLSTGTSSNVHLPPCMSHWAAAETVVVHVLGLVPRAGRPVGGTGAGRGDQRAR